MYYAPQQQSYETTVLCHMLAVKQDKAVHLSGVCCRKECVISAYDVPFVQCTHYCNPGPVCFFYWEVCPCVQYVYNM